MNNRFLHLILVLLVVSSCDQKTTIKESTPLSDIDEFKSFKIDIKAPKTKLTDLVASVEIARLEETPESLLSRVQHIFQHEDNLLFYNENNGDIFVFDQSGNFKKKINRTGNGPEEYKRIHDMWLEGNTIAIYARGTRNIKKYTFEGDFLESIRLPASVDHINSYRNGYAFGTNFIPFQDSLRYQWGVWNDKLELVQKYHPFDASSDNKIEVVYTLNTILPYQEDRSLLRVHSDTVYLLRDNEVSPFIHFDFGEDWFWTDSGTADTKDMSEIEASNQAWQNEINIGSESIYLMSFIGYIGWEHFLINRLDEKVTRLDIRRTSEELFTLFPLLWQEDLLLCTLPSNEVNEFINQIGAENVQYKQGTSLDIIESSENPVLLWVKFKNTTND